MANFSDDVPLFGTAGSTTTGAWLQWQGGAGRFMASCTSWNGATVSLQYQGPGGAADPIDADAGAGTTYTTFTANGGGRFDLPACQIRAAISVAVPSAPIFANATVIRSS